MYFEGVNKNKSGGEAGSAPLSSWAFLVIVGFVMRDIIRIILCIVMQKNSCVNMNEYCQNGCYKLNLKCGKSRKSIGINSK